MRSIFFPVAAIALLTVPSDAANAKSAWTCQFAKGQLVLTGTMQADPAPPKGDISKAKGLTLTGNTELVLVQKFLPNGKVDQDASNGTYRFSAYVKDVSGVIRYGDGGQTSTSEFIVDRIMPDGRFTGMFLNRKVTDGIGRLVSADFGDLTGATPPASLHFRLMPSNLHGSGQFFTKIPTSDFKALHAKGLGKAEAATSTELKKC